MSKSLQQIAFDRNAEIIAAYFADYYYNKLYSSASAHFSRHGGPSLTAVYMSFLRDFLRTMKEHEAAERSGATHGNSTSGQLMHEITLALHKSYDQYVGLGQRSIGEFVNIVISHFVPAEYYEVMQTTEKNSLICDIVRKTAIAIGERCAKPDMISFVIDDRKNTVGPSILQNKGLDVLRQYRASFMSELMNRSGKSPSKARMVSGELFESVRQVLTQTVKEASATEAAYIDLKRKYVLLEKQNAQLIAKIKSLTSAAAPSRPTPIEQPKPVHVEQPRPIQIEQTKPAPMEQSRQAPQELREEIPKSGRKIGNAPYTVPEIKDRVAMPSPEPIDDEDGFAVSIDDEPMQNARSQPREKRSRMHSESSDSDDERNEISEIAERIAAQDIAR